MSSYIKKLEFGNYTLNFGDKKVLLDLFEEVVMPSFFEMKYIRSLKDKGEYFFLDTRLIILDSSKSEPVLGVTGRIVKNTKLRREQIFRSDGGLIEDKSELETAPSSIFLIILNNHRVILCKEVPGAPTIQNFQSTSQYCLKERHKEYINELFDSEKKASEANDNKKRVTKKSIVESNPYPVLRITSLPDKLDLKDFIGRFDHIDKVVIKLMTTNKEEIDNDDFWSDFGRRRDEMNSKSTRVEFANSKEGLDPNKTYEQASSASNLGNSEVNFKGQDIYGDTLNGNNEDFNLTIELDELPKDTVRAAEEKYRQFKKLVKTGVIALPKVASSVLDKVKEISSRL